MISSSAPPSPLHVCFGEFELDEANARLLRKASAIALAPTPFALLCALVRHPGALLTKHALLDEVWGHRFVSDSVLKGAISDVRTVLGDDPREPRFIETVPRRGYRFIAAPTCLPEAPVHAGNAGDIRRRVQVTGQVPALPGASELGGPQIAFVGRAKEVASLRRAWDRVTSGRRVVILDRWRARNRQDHADRALRFGPRRSRLRTWSLRAALRKRRAIPSRTRSARGAVSQPTQRSTSAARRRADLAAAAALAQHRGTTRSPAARARRRQPGTDAPRNGRIPGPLHRAPTAVAGDGGLALGRSRDDPAHRLSRPPAQPGQPHVAVELQTRRGHRLGSSAQRVATRASSAWPLRGDRARFILRGGSRGIPGGALAVDGE